MFNFGTGIENVTHLKKSLSMVLLSVGQHLNLWPAIKTLSPDREELQSELPNSEWCKSSFLRSLLFDTSRAFQNIVAMLWVSSKWILNDKRNTIYSDYAIRKYQTILFHR